MPENPTHLLCDKDGVICRESENIPGVPGFFKQLRVQGIAPALLSNGSRQRGTDLVQELLDRFDIDKNDLPLAISSADATALWLQENPVPYKEQKVYVIGDEGVRSALRELNIPLCDHEWDGKQWAGSYPSDVVVGFSKTIDYTKLAGAWNAIKQGDARYVVTNSDPEYRGAGNLLLPANGAVVVYLNTAGKEPFNIGKPGIAFGEMALQSLGAEKSAARVVVLGDTIDQDVCLAANLKKAGWNTEAWVVLSGVVNKAEAEADPRIHKIFQDITDVREKMLS